MESIHNNVDDVVYINEFQNNKYRNLFNISGRQKKYIMLNRRPTFRMSSGHKQFYFSKENHMKCGHMRKFCMRCINLGYDKFIVGQC